MHSQYEEQAMVFKAFCDEKRLKILDMLKDGEMCACQILEEMPFGQSTLSHHMKILCDSGIVKGRREGKWIHYSLSPEGSAHALDLLHYITKSTNPISV